MPKTFGTILASWNIPEFEKYDRSIFWYVSFGLLGFFCLIYGLWTANFLFVLIIIIAAFIIYIQEKTEAAQIKCLITSKGVKLGAKFYLYGDIKQFWIIYDPPAVKKLYFSFRNILSPHLVISLKSQNPIKIREILLQFLEEDLEKEKEPFSESFSRWAKI